VLKRTLFWVASGTALLALTTAGLELSSSFLVPSWPARELRPVFASPGDEIKTLTPTQRLNLTYNSWGLRDRERSWQKLPGSRFRSVVVGDSFVEGAFVEPPLTKRIEERWTEAGRQDMEAINLGISATGPPDYYYRLKNVGLALHPDAVLLLFFSGNDFVAERLSEWRVPPLIDERPRPSILGGVAPRLTWLLVNRLGLSQLNRGNKLIADEFQTLNDAIKLPATERIEFFVRHLHKYYYPDLKPATLREILSRADDSFWKAFENRSEEPEFLAGWILNNMVWSETSTWQAPHDLAEADRQIDPSEIDATMSWLVGANSLVRSAGANFLVAVAPVAGAVDPHYREFWKQWPRYSSWNLRQEAAHHRLVAVLHENGMPTVDLEEDLRGINGAYRVSDSHWTELGTAIAARRLAAALEKVREEGNRSKAR